MNKLEARLVEIVRADSDIYEDSSRHYKDPEMEVNSSSH